MKKETSVFNIIGPVMVGPSSSHTAGAVRLGQIGRAILGCQPTTALIELYGSFAQTGRGHGTDRAIVAGLLGLSTDDEGIRHSFDLAGKSGLQFTFQEINFEGEEEVHPNTARLTLSAGKTPVVMTGASVGGGAVEITNVQGYAVSFNAEYHTLLLIADDRPGTVTTTTNWLFKHNINIAFLRVERGRRGGQAIMIIETDEAIPPNVLDVMQNFLWVHWARQIPRVSN